MHLMIAVPTYNGTIEVECMGSLYLLQSHLALTRPDLPTSLSYTVGAPVDMARNKLTTIFMNNKEATHLLFVDSDMGFQPQLIERLLNEDKPVTAAFCPYKVLELEALVRDGAAGAPIDKTMSIHSRYVASDQIVRDAANKFTMTQSGFVRVANIGPAIMLIKREVMESIGKDASLWRLGRAFREVSGPILEAFSAVIDEHGRPMSEDASFCRRWTNLGGEIWACASEEVTHVGRFAVKGRMQDQLMHFQDVKP